MVSNRRSHEDKGSSGEEVVPARKRRGRPLKQRIAVNVDQREVKDLVEGVDGNADYQQGGRDGDSKLKEDDSVGNGKKRSKVPKDESANLDLELEENSSSTRSKNDESTRSNGFRQNGSRRKSTPQRAAEAGL